MSVHRAAKLSVDSINKATSSRGGTPKEKHVRAIVTRTFQRDLSIDEIIRSLARRLEKPHWATVTKALFIFHRCLRDGDPKFIESLQSRSTLIFSLRAFCAANPPNNVYTVFLKKYARYLEEKVSVFRVLGFQFERQKDPCKGIKPPTAFKVIPKLQSQLNALLNCKLKAAIPDLIKSVYVLLLQDTLPLYAHLNDGLVSLLDLFWKLPKQQAQRVLNIYNLYIKETDALIGLYDTGKRFVRNLPTIKMPQNAKLIDQMEDYIKSAPSGDDYIDEPEEKHHKQDIMTSAHGPEDDNAPENKDSSEEEDESSEEEEDPFSFVQNNPFAGFSFVTPVFAQPFAGMQLPPPQANPFSSPSASNPFTPVQPSPFGATPNPFAVAPTPVAPNPYMNPVPQAGNPNPFAPVAFPPAQVPYGQQPAPAPNPFAANSNVNPFLPR